MSSLRALLIAAAAATSGARTVVPQPAALTRLQRLRGGNVLATPPDGFDGAVAAGSKKAAMPADKVFRLGVFSGVHIGFGALLMLTVGGACPGLAESNPGLHKLVLGAFGLPFGLMMTLLSGAELFTGNTALVTMALIEGKATTAGLVKSWVSSYAGNLAGSLLLAGLVSAGARHRRRRRRLERRARAASESASCGLRLSPARLARLDLARRRRLPSEPDPAPHSPSPSPAA